MKHKPYLNLRWVLTLTLTPLALAGLLVLMVQVQNLGRYDPVYFSTATVERYDVPGPVARDLETALREDDRALLAALQGLRRPQVFETRPNLRFALRWDTDAENYLTYLYYDTETYERYPYYVEQIEGRYVVAPQDLRFYLQSGRWKNLFGPLAITWWVVEIVVVLMVLVYRFMARQRAILFGR